MTNKIKLKVFKVKVNKYNIKTILKNYQIICDELIILKQDI